MSRPAKRANLKNLNCWVDPATYQFISEVAGRNSLGWGVDWMRLELEKRRQRTPKRFKNASKTQPAVDSPS
jgi:hypothetical protein